MKQFSLLLIPLFFAPEARAASNNGNVTFEGSLGVLNGSSTELVYESSGRKLSQLDWEIEDVPIIKLGIIWDVESDLTLQGRIWSVLTSNGDAHMEDRDWQDANQSSPTDISIHPDTKLRHAFEIDLNSIYWFVQQVNYKVGLLSGYQYNEFKWDGIGGTFSYNNGANVGSFADVVVIDYKQQYSVFYLGLAGEYTLGSRSEFATSVKWSPWVYAKDVDNHYLRNLRFYDDSNELSNFVSLSVNYGYRFSSQTKIYAEYVYTKYFEARADTTTVNTSTGATSFSPNAAGLDNEHSTVSIGLNYLF
ncbi:omptin family outer membrane protease [Vibrio sp. S4M6]|uniref:omptin family outer membrane protease n=1 Tax=Vibrio sinus TaxID=2946865 RepID=UPI00202A06AB|nr:omptin family outer membrane protease [Vibrio sinus]MCL9780188.1 omptin family outer membrane protease [Vibrio sinus]